MSSTNELELLPQGAELLFGTYKLTAPLSRSDSYITYLAVDKMGQKSLIKECFLEGHCRRDGGDVVPIADGDQAILDAEIAKLKREAKNLGKLEHRNIVRIDQIFQENGTAYISMKYVEGTALEGIIDSGKSLRPEDVQQSIETLLSALKYLGENNILHRAINPEHIVMRSGNDPVLVGFGRSVEAEVGQYIPSDETDFLLDPFNANECSVIGAAQTARSDLYSLGAVAYQLISGQAPAMAEDRVAQVSNGMPDPLPKLAEANLPYPEVFLQTVDQALSLDPAERPESPTAWLAALNEGSDDMTDDVPSAAVIDASGKSGGKLKYVISGVVLAAATGALVTGLSLTGSDEVALAEREKEISSKIKQELSSEISKKEAQLQAEKERLQREAELRAAELAKKEAKLAVELKVIQEAAATHEKVTAQRDAEAQMQFEEKMRELKAQREKMENAFIERETGFAKEREELEAKLANTLAQLESGQTASSQSGALKEQLAQLEAERDSLRQEAELRTAALSANQAEIEARLVEAEEMNAKRIAEAVEREEDLKRQLSERQAALEAQRIQLEQAQNERQAALEEQEKALAEQQKAAALLEQQAKEREATLADQLAKQQEELAAKQEKLQEMLAQLDQAKAAQEKALEEQRAAQEAAEAERLALEEKLKASEAAAQEAAAKKLRELEEKMQQEIAEREQAKLAASEQNAEQIRALEEKMQAAIQEKEDARVAASDLKDKLEKANQIERLVAVTEPEGAGEDAVAEPAPVEQAAAPAPAPNRPAAIPAQKVALLPVDQQIVSEDWSVDMPFGLALSIDSKGKPVFKLSRVDASRVPSWMETGMEIHQVNGAGIRRRGDLERALIKAVEQNKATSLTVKRSGQRRLENRLLKLSQSGKVRLQTGAAFSIQNTKDGWVAVVDRASASDARYLMTGDVIKLDGPSQLKEIMQQAVVDQTPEVELNVMRNNENIGALLVLTAAEN